jgi:hypothetical protein
MTERLFRVIGRAEEHPQHVGLPRGCVDDLKELLSNRLKSRRRSGARPRAPRAGIYTASYRGAPPRARRGPATAAGNCAA